MNNRKLKTRTFSGTTNPEVTERELRHRALARRAAREGMVLLKNEENLLPLAPGSRVALYGIGAVRTIKGGTGSGDVNERESVSIYQGLKNAGYVITNEEQMEEFQAIYEKARIDWRDGILRRLDEESDGLHNFFNVYSTSPFFMPAGGEVKNTDTDTCIYVLSRIAGENADRFLKDGDYLLNEIEKVQLAAVSSYYNRVIVVINTGGLMDLSFVEEYPNIKALLQIVQPGMEGGNAFADVLSGVVSPSGKMTDSWAYRYEDYPNAMNFSHLNGNVEKETYNEDIYVGYRYFDTFDIPVRYSFGYGLSYTTFNLEPVFFGASQGGLSFTVEVTNTGKVPGKEVVQLYASLPVGELKKEYRRLIAFEKTKELAPGESDQVTLTCSYEGIASYDEKEPGWVLEAGYYGIWLGNSLCEAELFAAYEAPERKVLEKTINLCPLKEELSTFEPDAEKQLARYAELVSACEELIPVMQLDLAAIPTKVAEYKKNEEIGSDEAKAFVDTLSLEQCIALATGDPGKGQGSNLGSAGISVPGSAGETSSCALAQGLASIVLSDGPAGLRLMKSYNVDNGRILMKPFLAALEGGIFAPEQEEMPGETYYQYCTAIPVGTLLAQSFDTELVAELGGMIGREMQEFQTTLWLAPGMNIHRNPLCGRNFEYYSEDPLVAGSMAAAMTRGVQSVPGCGTTIKHYACNNQEDNRMGSDSILTERALREIYLKGFELCVKEAHPLSIMTSYNLINGVHAANCYDTCTNAARNEWGFDGVIMTDWTTTMVDETCTAAGCMRAGNDLVMPGCTGDHENIRAELAAGTLTEAELRACVARLVHVVWKSGWYE